MFKRAIITFLAALIATGMFTIPATASQNFTDVPTGSWATGAISSAVDLGLMQGMGGGIFGYGRPVTHGEFEIILQRMSHILNISHGAFSHEANTPLLREEMAVIMVNALGYRSITPQIERNEPLPFTDVTHNIGHIIMANDIGMMHGVAPGVFNPAGTITREQAAAILTRIYYKLDAPLSWVHGFYAFGSFAQRGLIRDMDSVSFGWSVMEWCAETGPRLSTSETGGNQWRIPAGYELIANYPREYNARSHLNVFMDTSIGLADLLACEQSRGTAAQEIIAEATRVYSGIGRSPFDGVTINFEGLRGATAQANFTAFLTELSAGLGGMSLYVTVHPATADGVYFDGYDFRAIGRLADRVILMTHDYHPRSLDGFVGTAWQRHAATMPIAQVYHALKAITDPITGVEDRNKIAIAFSFHNVGWFVDNAGLAVAAAPVTVSMETVLARMAQPDTVFGWSDTYRNPYIIYTTEGGEQVFLWHKNSRSVSEMLQLARLFDITGVSVWRLGIVPNDADWDVWENFVR